jgi:FAD/FMN-containing dehydrogenase
MMRLLFVFSALLVDALVRADAMAMQAAIDDCLSTAGVPVDSKGSTAYTQDITPFNGRLSYTPIALAVPTTIAQIQGAVQCGAKVGVKVTPKGGGHSYASFSLGGENGHLVVNLDRMKTVTFDKSTNIATVQPGARLGHVFNSLNGVGRAFSHGTCPG